MGRAKKTRKFAQVKKMRIAKRREEADSEDTKKEDKYEVEQHKSSLFLEANVNLKPPYRVLVDTNFINFAVQNKLDVLPSMMDCLLAKCIPCVTDCVIAELEKMGQQYRLALKIALDPRFERLTCQHKGTYADDCIVQRVQQHRCYIVGTNDKDLKNRLRKIPGVPLMYVKRGKFDIELLPERLSMIPLSN